MSLDRYYLKNKDKVLLSFYFDEIRYPVIEEVSKESIIPNFILNRFSNWLISRVPPKHREFMKEIFKVMGVDRDDIKAIIDYSKGLSLTDTLWITKDLDQMWADVSLYRNDFDDVISRIAFDGGLYGNKIKTTSPELATDGMLAKCWVREDAGIYLYKRGTAGGGNTGYEPYCEAMATQILEVLGYNHVKYDVVYFRDNLASKCALITDENISMIPLYVYSGMENAVEIERYALDNNIKDEIYKMSMLDYIIFNTDRHLGNFSVLVDSETFELKGMAPIYDNGMSCLCYYRDTMYKSLDEYVGLYTGSLERNSYVPMDRVIRQCKGDVRKLVNFEFNRNRLLDCPERHIKLVERFIKGRVENILR